MKYSSLYNRYCHTLKEQNLFRELSTKNSASFSINFSSNDYLNFSTNKEIIEAGIQALHHYPVGATGSRLLSGNHPLYTRLEKQIAKDKGFESALVLGSGYLTNMTILMALLDQQVLQAQPVVFCDRHNHSSIYQGILNSKAQLVRFKHNDVDSLERQIKKIHPSIPKFLVIESVYSMDGDQAPLQKMIDLCKNYKIFIYIDEAHATGVLGETGYGLSPSCDFQEVEGLVMGTFSKALGLYGAYIACSFTLRTYLINKVVGFIYSTGLPPVLLSMIQHAWTLIASMQKERTTLQNLASQARILLKEHGYTIGQSSTQIIPIIFPHTENTPTQFLLELSKKLQNQGIIIPAIRYPTVQKNMERLRMSLMLSHTYQDIKKFVHNLDTYTRGNSIQFNPS